MIKFLIVLFLALYINSIQAIDINADLFSYDEKKVESEFAELSKLENFINENPLVSAEELLDLFPIAKEITGLPQVPLYKNTELLAPGKFPSFLFTFIFSTIGTYFIYGAVAGPIAVGIVYFSTHKDRIETKKAIWGCVTGTLIGAGIKLVVVNL